MIKNIKQQWFSDYNCFEYKISEVENQISDTSSLVTTTVLNTKIEEAENKIPDHVEYIAIPEFNKLKAT